MNAPTPREAYENPKLRHGLLSIRPALPLDAVLDTWEAIGRQPDIVGHLDRLHEEDNDLWYDLEHVLLELSSETIYQTYGAETLAWAALNSYLGDPRENRVSSLQELAGWDGALLEKVWFWDWQKFMVNVAGQVAVKAGLPTVGIQGGKNNKWTRTQPGDTELHITIKQAKAAYDKPAKRLGFKKDAKGDWRRPASALVTDS